MAYTGFSATPTASEWNDLFQDLADIVNGWLESVSDYRHAIASHQSKSVSGHEVTFSVSSPCLAKKLVLDIVGGAAGTNTASVSLEPVDQTNQDFMIGQGTYPSLSVSASGSGTQGTGELGITEILIPGVRYKLAVSVDAGTVNQALPSLQVTTLGVKF